MPTWLDDAVFYEIYPQSFCDSNGDGIGDLPGITSRLPYLADLGIRAIWLNPCFASPFLDAGYDVSDYRLVAPRYGTNADLTELFSSAHRAGIRVILDLVPGHTSYQHPWFRESASATRNVYSDRYIWTDSVWEDTSPHRMISGMTERNGNFVTNFFSSQPALNYGFGEVTKPWQLPADHAAAIATREEMKDVMRFWLDRGCDGFRVDMAGSLVKNDPDKKYTSAIWTDVRGMLDAEYPEAALVAEWSRPSVSIPAGFHADFYLDDEGSGYRSLLREADPVTGSPAGYFAASSPTGAARFAEEFRRDYDRICEKGFVSLVSGNHDTTRLSHFLTPDEQKLAIATLLTLPGLPFLYYGDEIGMRFVEGLVSKEGGYARTGSRTPMQWDEGPNAGFSDASQSELYLPIDSREDAPTVAAQRENPDSLWNVIRDVILLRHREKDLHGNGDFEILSASFDAAPFVFRRRGLIIAVNPKLQAFDMPLRVSSAPIFRIGPAPAISGETIVLAPQSFAVMRV